MLQKIDTVRALRESLASAYRRFNVLERTEKCCFGVTMSQCMTLEALLRDGRSTVGSLAETLGLDKSTVTRVVDVLVRDGLLARTRDEKTDRRRVFVSLTPRGRALAKKLEQAADTYCERILERLPEQRRSEVLEVLDVLVAALAAVPQDVTQDGTKACC
jgi:DNA-binding MarR family transcriptional regulator